MSSVSSIKLRAPDDFVVVPYDREHLLTYARVLDADDARGDWREAAAAILGCDVSADLAAAEACWISHLARARWVVGEGVVQMTTSDTD